MNESHVNINPVQQVLTVKEQHVSALREELGTETNPMPFPEQTVHANEYTYPSIQSLAFPALFPFGKGDVSNNDRNIFVSLTESNRFLLKYCACDAKVGEYTYPFATHDRWIHWAQNTSERHRVNSQKNAYLNQNPEDSNLTEEGLKKSQMMVVKV